MRRPWGSYIAPPHPLTSSRAPSMIAIKVPPLGESVVEATISRWAKQPGDGVAAGETIVELETDKVTVEVPALKPGVLVSQAKQAGDVVKVDELLGTSRRNGSSACHGQPRRPQRRAPRCDASGAAAPCECEHGNGRTGRFRLVQSSRAGEGRRRARVTGRATHRRARGHRPQSRHRHGAGRRREQGRRARATGSETAAATRPDLGAGRAPPDGTAAPHRGRPARDCAREDDDAPQADRRESRAGSAHRRHTSRRSTRSTCRR